MINRTLIEQAEQKIKRAYTALDTVIILQGDQRVYAAVFNPACALDKPTSVYSVTKSITATLIGIAIDNGYISSVDQTLTELLPELCAAANPAAGVGEITLHQLLSMTSGQLWNNGGLQTEPMLNRIMQQPDWLHALLKLPVNVSQTGQFKYSTGTSHLLSAIIHHTTGATCAKFAAQYLFTPLGITDYHWEMDPQGYNTGGWGLHLTPDDMAKFGQLILRQGEHNQSQLISAHWITASTTAYTAEYGYQWWLKSSKELQCWCAQGLGGQFICCIPSLNAVIVTTSQFAGRRKNLWAMFEDYWLPALRR